MMICSEIDGQDGFHLKYKLTSSELELVRGLIYDHWIKTLHSIAPTHVSKFEAVGLEGYHLVSHLIDHAKVWGKYTRILPAASLSKFEQTSLIKNLQREFGDFEISDEDRVGHGEVYWRIVRPDAPADVGPLHADRWFFEYGEKEIPKDKRMIKIWTAIFCEPGLSGLKVLRGSHRKTWKHHGERRDGFIKPIFDEDPATIPMEPLLMEPGQAIVFNDLLLHGGMPTKGAKTRISLEFAIFVPKDRFSSTDSQR